MERREREVSVLWCVGGSEEGVSQKNRGEREREQLTCRSLNLCCSHREDSLSLSPCLEQSSVADPRKPVGPHTETAPVRGNREV